MKFKVINHFVSCHHGIPAATMSTSEIPDIASLPPVRRVVTGGNDEKNKSEVLYDDTNGNVQ